MSILNMSEKMAEDVAQGLIRGFCNNISYSETFNHISGIYRFTNENITSYFHHLQNKEEVLSVISSGNHILNAILGGAKRIDGFDISIFPEYYLYLQIATIITFDKDEYLEYLLSDDRDIVFSDKFYDRLRVNLNGKYKKFWDYLYEYNEAYDIYNSLLFRTGAYFKNIVIENNPYLQDDNYEKLRNILKVDSIKINTMVKDVTKTKFDKEYDLILLSNILAYYFKLNEIDEYFEFLKNNFKLKENGELIDFDFTARRTEAKRERLNKNSYIEETEKSKVLIYRK